MRALLILAALTAAACGPTPPPEPPEPPDSDPTSHCASSCAALQRLECKRGSNEVCAEFDAESGECTRTHDCVAACEEAPHAYPEYVDSCPGE